MHKEKYSPCATQSIDAPHPLITALRIIAVFIPDSACRNELLQPKCLSTLSHSLFNEGQIDIRIKMKCASPPKNKLFFSPNFLTIAGAKNEVIPIQR